jgi:hypothetical protein
MPQPLPSDAVPPQNSIFDRYKIVSETDLREAEQKVGVYLPCGR